MWKSKKFILIALLAVIVLVGSTVGVVFAQTENGDESQPKTLLGRVAEILDIDQQKLEDAFAQARSEMRDEALDSRLQNLVDQGLITQDEANQYKEWWQSRPAMQLPRPFGRLGGHGFRSGMRWGGGHPFYGEPNLTP